MTLAVGDKAPSTLVGQIAYLPFGPLLRLTWGNGIALSREYDQDYQLLRQRSAPGRATISTMPMAISSSTATASGAPWTTSTTRWTA